MRPVYETEGDRSRESAVARKIETAFRCSMSKLQPRDRFDYACIRGDDIVAFAEIKVRKNPMHQYDTYMVSMTKIVHANMIHSAVRLPCILFVQWLDALGYIPMNRCDVSLRMGGRSDRNDPLDIEPVCHIDISRFRIVR